MFNTCRYYIFMEVTILLFFFFFNLNTFFIGCCVRTPLDQERWWLAALRNSGQVAAAPQRAEGGQAWALLRRMGQGPSKT